ncbi:MAG: LamG domain-containing protein [Planctomycetes bacterium]|nr:LamG domain-containing protein [Planctomycetota bacterium]
MSKKLFVLLTFFVMLSLVFANVAFADIIEVGIADDNDDAEQHLIDNPRMDIGSSDLEIPYEDGGVPPTDLQAVGVRYVVNIESGSMITSATLTLQADKAEKDGTLEPVNVVIRGELSPDAAQFGNDTNNITDRPTTAASVLWSIPPYTEIGQREQSPDLSAIIQEIIDQDGWAAGNGLVLIISDDPDNPSTGLRETEAGPGDDSVLLTVEFSFEGASAPSPANAEVDVKAAPVLTWSADETAFQHDLYLGTDADLVAAGDASVLMGSLAEARYEVDVNFPLERGITYYWKVDVSTGTSRASELHPGNVWNFRVADINTESWLTAAAADSPAFLETFVEDDLYDIGALSGDITYEFVVISNPDEQEASMALIGRRGFGDTEAGLKYEQWNNTGTYGATLFGVVDLDYGVPTSPGEHTVLTFLSSEASNTTALYINGALAGSVDSAITLSGLVGIGYGASGEDMSGAFDNFDGTIFGVAIYDEALSDEQIAAHADAYFNPVTDIVPVNPGTEGLVAYYAFENDVNDISGNGNDGTIVGDPVFVDGPTGFGTAMEFDGDGDYVDVGNDPNLDITGDITLACWIKVDVFDKNWQAIVTHGDNSWRVHRSGSSNNIAFGSNGLTPAGDLTGSTDVSTGAWFHVAAVYDGAQKLVYIDGALDASADTTGNIDSSTYNVNIGENNQQTGRHFAGLIDEVMIYNRALSDLEVMYLAGKRVAPVDPGSDGLLAFWPGDEGAGAVVADASGNGRDGTFVNGDPAWVEGVNGTAVELVAPTLIEIQPLNMELSGATMAGWIKPNGPQNDWASIIMTRPPASGFNIIAPSGFQLAYHWNDTDTSWGFRGNDFIAEDDWTFAAVTIAPDKATFYVNGEQGSVNEVSHDPIMWDANIYLGGDFTYADTDRKMNGALDEVVMYDRALSAGEIRYLAGARAMDDVLGPDVTGLGDVVQGVPNDGDWPGNEHPALAIDDDPTTKYLHRKGGSMATGIQIEPASGPSIVTGLTFTTANDDYGRDPITFELSGSNESIEGPYELIASGDIVDFAQEELWPRFTMNATPIMFENTVAYTYYQIVFPTLRTAAPLMQIAEVELRVSKF